MKRGAAHGRAQIARCPADGRKSVRRNAALFRQKCKEPGIWLVRGEPTHRSAGNSTAHFHGADHHFHAGNRRPRKRLALELHVEATAFLSGDADRSSILSRAPKEKFPKPVVEAAARIFFAAQQESARSIAKQTAEFARDAVGCECPAASASSVVFAPVVNSFSRFVAYASVSMPARLRSLPMGIPNAWSTSSDGTTREPCAEHEAVINTESVPAGRPIPL